jgi:hypothetical protein
VTSRRVFLALAAAAPAYSQRIRLCGISFRVITNKDSSRRFFWIHGDETTAAEVLKDHMKRFPGRALLVDNPAREIKAGRMEFDPNRMFSEPGLRKNVKKLNPGASERDCERIVEMVARDREKLIAWLTPPTGGLLIALHNNRRGYSVHDEVEWSHGTSMREPDAPTDFYISTNPVDFEALKGSPYNAVLQSTPKGEDDGSLSRLAASRKIRYVNIETLIGRREKQRKMLEWLEANLK